MSSESRALGVPARWLVLLAFAAIYLVWGSTYLAIRIALVSIPPFLLGGIRFITAGTLMFGWAWIHGASLPTRMHWRSGVVIGLLLLLGGNGGVTWAEQSVPSGLAALLVAIVPLWIVLLTWLRPGGKRPDLPVLAGVLVGLVGIGLLVGPRADGQSTAIDPIGVLSLLIGTFCWASGSLYSRTADLPASPVMTTGMEMLCGGVALLLAGTLTGEWMRFDVSQVSWGAAGAAAYLVFFGAIIGFTAYIWLLRVTTPARAATYAYVNPVVAVFLGWAFAGESITSRTIVAAAIIISAVVIITSYRDKPSEVKAVPVRPVEALSGEV